MKLKFYVIEKLFLFISIMFIYIFNYNTTNGLYLFTNLFIVIFIFIEFLDIIRNKKLRTFKLSFSFFLFFLICLVSLLYSFSFELSLSKVKTMLVLMLYLFSLVNYIAKSKEHFIELLKIIVFSNFLSVLYTILGSNWSAGIRANGIVGDANQSGVYFAYSSIISFFCYQFIFKNKLSKFFCLISIILTIFANMIGGSRTAFVVNILGIVLYLLFKDTKNIKLTLRNLIFISLFSIICIYTISNVPFLYDIIGVRFKSFFEIIQGNKSSINETSTENRFLLIKTAYNMFSKNLFTVFLGNGIGSFQAYSNLYLNFNAFCHNNFFELLSGVGIVGFFSYYYLYFKLFLLSIKKIASNIATLKVILIIIIQMLISHFFVVFYYQKLEIIFISILIGLYYYQKDFCFNN